jgi:hypothetical protein
MIEIDFPNSRRMTQQLRGSLDRLMADLANCFCAAAICSGRLKRKRDAFLPLLEHAIA